MCSDDFKKRERHKYTSTKEKGEANGLLIKRRVLLNQRKRGDAFRGRGYYNNLPLERKRGGDQEHKKVG